MVNIRHSSLSDSSVDVENDYSVLSTYYAASSCECVCVSVSRHSDEITGHVGRLNLSVHLHTASRETVTRRRKEKS